MTDQEETEFWAERDPYGDRFAKRFPWWGCLLSVAALVAVIVLAFKFGFFVHGD